MGLASVVGPWLPDTVFEEIRTTVHGYNTPGPLIGAAQTAPVNGRIASSGRPDPIRSSHDTLFTSGTLGRYSKVLHAVMEGRGRP
jgi:NADH-quinone oxidoreductase subunit G